MRYYFYSLLIISTILASSACKKTGENYEDPSSIVGNWKLIEVYSDPGDGSGEFREVDGKKTLEFRSDGQVKSNNGRLCSIDIMSTDQESSTYKIKELEDGVRHLLSIDKCDSDIYFEIENDVLTVYYFCIEGCGEKFKRIR